jgi:peptidyl-prolyl cis-trans isomerase B (cyclophilin B)
MARVALAAVVLLALAPHADAAPEASLKDRAAILAIEMRRDAAALAPYLSAPPGSATRRLAIRALGRIGDDGTGPGILRDVLSATDPGDPDLRLWLWAAGIARSEELSGPLTEHLRKHVAAGQYGFACQAARSLGWTGGEGVVASLQALLGHENPAVRAAALGGIARARPTTRDVLDAVSRLAGDPNADVRAAADYASWLAAAGYKTAQEENADFDGDDEIAGRFLGHLRAPEPARRMGGIRVLGSLMPKAPAAGGPYARVLSLVADPDPRVGQDAAWRILAPREGAAVDAALAKALAHPDPKNRRLAAEALGQHATPAAVEALAARFAEEPDARMREVLALELVRVGKEDAWKKLRERKDRAADPYLRQETDALVLLASKRKEALDELFQYADPGASQRVDLHAGVWMRILGELEGRQHPRLEEWLTGFLAGGYAIDRDERHFVIAAAVALVAANELHGLDGKLLELLVKSPFGRPHAEIRAALMEAFATLGADPDAPKEMAAAMRLAVAKHMQEDDSPWVRAKARAAAKALRLDDVPDFDEGQPNEWRGLPRPAVEGEEDAAERRQWLTEEEILELADWITEEGVLIAFETTAGTFTVALDARAAPMHAVNLLLATRAGIYEGTRWHRVVPNFVIQGGDPHGHGAGGGGWTVPDEINRNPYVRGALGMPKSIKDDGGCQIFVMHTDYPPLDERYTCYGHVVNGMDTVDRIRVGDFIESARVVVK